jgi:hypothetical protein
MYCSKQCKDNAYDARQCEAPENNVNAHSENDVNACRRCGKPIALGLRRPRRK